MGLNAPKSLKKAKNVQNLEKNVKVEKISERKNFRRVRDITDLAVLGPDVDSAGQKSNFVKIRGNQNIRQQTAAVNIIGCIKSLNMKDD